MTISSINSNYNSSASAAKTTATKAETKTYSNTSDYLSELQKQYSFAGGTSKIGSVDTSVSISSSLLRDCLNDPEKQAWLEENLAAIPDGIAKIAKNPSGTLRQVSISIDAQGNVSSTSYGTFSSDDSDGVESFVEKMQKQVKEAQEKTQEKAEKHAKERDEEEAAAISQPYSFTVEANEVESLLEKARSKIQERFADDGLQSNFDLRV